MHVPLSTKEALLTLFTCSQRTRSCFSPSYNYAPSLFVFLSYKMAGGKSCIVCKHTKTKDPSVHMHRFPRNLIRRKHWCKALCIQEKELPRDARVCSRHFLNGDTSNLPSLSMGKRFASPKKHPLPVRIPLQACSQGGLLGSSEPLSPNKLIFIN